MTLHVWLTFIVAATRFTARVLQLLREPHHLRWLNRGFGSVFMLAAGFLALFRRAI